MSKLPKIFGDGRAAGIGLVAALAVGQAVAVGAAAFATRDVFAAFNIPGADLPVGALALIIASGVAIAVLRVGERQAGESVGQAYAASVRKTLFCHLTRMPASAVSQRRSGGLALRFVGDLTAVRSWVSMGVARIISTAIVLPGALIALIILDPALAMAAALPLTFSLGVMALLAPRLKPLHRRLRGRRARLAADMIERIPVAPELRLLGRDQQETQRLDKSARSLRDAAVARARASAVLKSVPEIGASAAGVALLATAFVSGARAAEAAGALATLSILTLTLRDLAGIWDRRHAWEVARDKCRAILESPVLADVPKTASDDSVGPASVRFENVCSGALYDVIAEAAPGQKIAIVGPNGAGKSTFLLLAAGLEHPTAGQVSIDDADIRSLSHLQRQQCIVFVGSRSPVLQGSLRRSLTLGIKPRPDDDTIEKVARSFGLDRVIERLGGLNGRVSECGRNLSSGEVRRVHLVRASLANPRLLLLDEPDDALDGQGRDYLDRLFKNTTATTLVVTHDPSLARKADAIWLVADGMVCAAGGSDDVTSGDGPIARFFRPRFVA